jgi:energy-coupling factor transporter ATP-binding protein EcfA2
MKLSKIHIDSHFHLENISFDFVYPEGHSKAGQPLEKICIIGQSATGKTKILELIKKSILGLKSAEVVNDVALFTFRRDFAFNGSITYLYNNELLTITSEGVLKGNKFFKSIESGGGTITNLIEKGLKLIYLSSDIISKETVDILNQNPSDLSNRRAESKSKLALLPPNPVNYIYEFDQNFDELSWYSLLSEILSYRKRFAQMASELINKGSIGDFKKLNKEFEKWASKNENPLVKFANYFNPVLKRLNLEVDLVNTEFSIPIKSKVNDNIVPISGLSTGTKGLLLSMFPIYELDTTDSIILIDEPERSLFPDMQIDLIENYQNLAPKSQIIVATHSPFIAASFEPEERFILYHDEDGKVTIRQGESPIGDDPNDILRSDFNINYYNKFGQEAYKRYVSLKEQMANENNPQRKKDLLKDVTQLGDEYKF